MSIIFFGNTKYSTIIAKKLHQHIGLTAIVTLPDRLIGRKQVLTPTPTKILAEQYNIPVITAEKLTDEVITKISTFHPDFLIVADYRLFLPDQLLKIPQLAAINVHHSLLPKYRGPSPAPAAILAGDTVTGVTIIKMTNEVDAGDMLTQKEYSLQQNETTDSLLTQLNKIGAEILLPVLHDYQNYNQHAKQQNQKLVTFTTHMSKQDGFIDLDHPPTPQSFDRMIRAYYPWPNVWTIVKMKNKEVRIKFFPEEKIQIEGKNLVMKEEFYRGYPELKDKLEKLY